MAKKKSRSSGRKKSFGGGSFSRIFTNKIFISMAALFLILGGIFFGIKYLFLSSEFFAIKEVSMSKQTDGSLAQEEAKLRKEFSGLNIFSVDLRMIKAKIMDRQPQLRKVEVLRVFPNKLEINIITRDGVAYVESGGGLVVDHEGSVVSKGEKNRGLVTLKGISFFLKAPGWGEKIENDTLMKALVLLDGLEKAGLVKKYKITSIDVTDRNNFVASCSGVGVKMGSDDFAWKISRLSEILRDPNIDLTDINYIDLRFENAVISPK